MTAAGARARPRPCVSCPYRRDVPSGIWEAEEYDKLPAYDGDIPGQPARPFFCHHGDGAVCAGWLGHRDPAGLLAVRLGCISGQLDESVLGYTTRVPLFASGAEAREHGERDIGSPGADARAVIARILRRDGER